MGSTMIVHEGFGSLIGGVVGRWRGRFVSGMGGLEGMRRDGGAVLIGRGWKKSENDGVGEKGKMEISLRWGTYRRSPHDDELGEWSDRSRLHFSITIPSTAPRVFVEIGASRCLPNFWYTLSEISRGQPIISTRSEHAKKNDDLQVKHSLLLDGMVDTPGHTQFYLFFKCVTSIHA